MFTENALLAAILVAANIIFIMVIIPELYARVKNTKRAVQRFSITCSNNDEETSRYYETFKMSALAIFTKELKRIHSLMILTTACIVFMQIFNFMFQTKENLLPKIGYLFCNTIIFLIIMDIATYKEDDEDITKRRIEPDKLIIFLATAAAAVSAGILMYNFPSEALLESIGDNQKMVYLFKSACGIIGVANLIVVSDYSDIRHLPRAKRNKAKIHLALSCAIIILEILTICDVFKTENGILILFMANGAHSLKQVYIADEYNFELYFPILGIASEILLVICLA